MNTLNAYEKFALLYFLDSYPENVGLHAIFDMMLEYSDDIEYNHLFFDADPADVINEIESMIIGLQHKFTPRVV